MLRIVVRHTDPQRLVEVAAGLCDELLRHGGLDLLDFANDGDGGVRSKGFVLGELIHGHTFDRVVRHQRDHPFPGDEMVRLVDRNRLGCRIGQCLDELLCLGVGLDSGLGLGPSRSLSLGPGPSLGLGPSRSLSIGPGPSLG